MIRGVRSGRGARHGALAALALGIGLAGCGGGGEGPVEVTAGVTAAADSDKAALASRPTAVATRAVPQPRSTEGRLLASNCFQCHGTLGTGGFDNIRGKEASEVLEFLRKPAGKDIMAAHAQGYTTAQLQKVIAYLQQ